MGTRIVTLGALLFLTLQSGLSTFFAATSSLGAWGIVLMVVGGLVTIVLGILTALFAWIIISPEEDAENKEQSAEDANNK